LSGTRVWTWRRRLAVATILILVLSLAAGAVSRFERHGIASLSVAGGSLIIFGMVSITLRLTASDDFLRRHLGDAGVASRRRVWWNGVVAMLLGTVMLGVPYGLDYFEHSAAEAARRSGNARLQAGEYALAIEEFNTALRLDPKSAEAYHGRGLAHLQLGEYDRAVADLSETIQLNPTEFRAFFNRGVMYSRTGDYDRALADFGEAIRLNPNYAKAYLARSRVFLKTGDAVKADADRQKAFELDPSLKKDRDGTLVRRSPYVLESPAPSEC
jgi:Tfp pilus assembly protein PilF